MLNERSTLNGVLCKQVITEPSTWRLEGDGFDLVDAGSKGWTVVKRVEIGRYRTLDTAIDALREMGQLTK
jgi:hypothetical protein